MDKSTITYKLSSKELLKEIYHYYENMFYHKSLVVDETLNLVRFYLEYIFRLNNLKTNDFIINIHAITIKEDEDFLAYMELGDRKNEYHVYLNRDKMKCTCEFDIYLNTQLMYNAGHEFEHVVQYTFNAREVTDYYLQYKNIDNLIQKCNKKIKTKKLNGKEDDLHNDLDILHSTEMSADRMSHRYYISLLEDLINITDDDFMIENFKKIITEINKIQKSRELIFKDVDKRYRSEKKYFKRHGEKLDILD